MQGRGSLISREWKDELYEYITGIVKSNNQKLLEINGVSNHIHILLNIKPSIALSNLVRDIKANSIRFVNEKRFVKGKFNWQEGFGAFSYSISQLDNVIQYIHNQEEHHNETSFKDEYLKYLKRFEIEFDENFVFEWIEE